MAMSYADVNGVSLYYEEHGSGQPLILLHGGYRRDGWYPESLAGMDQMGSALAGMLMQSPVYENYSRVAPRVEDFPVLLDKTGELLRRDYDWSAEIAKITAPVMLVYGDADAVRPAHIVEFYALLGGGLRDANWDGSERPVTRLAILPGHTRYDVFASADLPAAVMPFLDAQLL
jgi:pimeloyl-ACP methyl ester carboxylesterase